MQTVGDHMTSSVLSIDLDESINNAASKIYDNQIGSLLVTQNEKFIGIITKTDLMVKVLIKNLDGNSTRVSEVMSQPLITINIDDPLDTAKKLFNEKPIRHMAVTRNDEVVGVLSTKDLR